MFVSNQDIFIAAILHAYQPPTQNPEILERIVKNCYLPIIRVLEENSSLKVTLNINASLTEQLEKNHISVIEGFAELAKNMQIEFLESGAYHPILPLMSTKEVKLQIKLNNKINSRVFGEIWKPQGFWPPELAVSETIAAIIESLGYRYMIIPEIAISSNSPFPTPLYNRVLLHPNTPNLAFINRNREVSNNISFKKYSSIDDGNKHFQLLKELQPDGAIVFATDLETFGEHHRNYEKFLRKILENNNSILASQLLEMPSQPIVEFRSSSWSTSEEDLFRDVPFPLWAYPGNSIHDLLSYHSDLLSELTDYLLLEKDENDYDVKLALKAVAKAQYSCQTWWASTKDHFSKELILKGFNAQRDALELVLKAVNGERMLVMKGLSDRIEKKLDRYLSRMK